jgi:hypothetical protein
MTTAIGRARQSSVLRALGFGSVAAIGVVSVWGTLASPTVLTGSGGTDVLRAYLDARPATTTTAWLLAILTLVGASLAWHLVVERRRLAGIGLWDLLRDRDAGTNVPAFIFGPLIIEMTFAGTSACPRRQTSPSS